MYILIVLLLNYIIGSEVTYSRQISSMGKRTSVPALTNVTSMSNMKTNTGNAGHFEQIVKLLKLIVIVISALLLFNRSSICVEK